MHGHNTNTRHPSWGELCARIDIASDLWTKTISKRVLKGLPASDEAVFAVEKALDFAESCASWTQEEITKARRQEFLAFPKQIRIYLRKPHIHWSPEKSAALLKSKGISGAIRGAFDAFSSYCSNLLPAAPLKHSPHDLRHDAGGKLLELSSLLCGGGPSRRSSGDIALRERILLAHGTWCKNLKFSSTGDYFFGGHCFGYGTWIDQLSAGADCASSRWGADLLCAAEAQLREKLQAPAEHQRAAVSFGAFLTNHAGRSASGETLGRHEWLWNIQFPLPEISREQITSFQKNCSYLNGYQPEWKDNPPVHWKTVIEEVAIACCGPDGRELQELQELQNAQSRWLALKESMEISQYLDSKRASYDQKNKSKQRI